MIKCLSVLLIFVLATLISIPQSIAQESSNSTAQYALQLKQLKKDGVGKINPITYGVFYVTSKDQCTDYDNQRLEFYQTVIDQYLSLYELAHNQEYAACISEKEHDEYFSQISPTVIPVVIMSENAAQRLLIQQGNYGLYTISGIGSESIIVCACDGDIESWQGSWVLSHELSHLALYNYGAPESVYFTWVHYNEAMSYVCKILDQSSFCPEYSTTVTAPSGNPVPVMEIYGQGATAYNMPSNPPQIDIPIFQQPVLEKGLGEAIQVHVLPPTPELNILASVEVGGLEPLIIDSVLYPIPYNITGGIIEKITADSVAKKLTVEVIGGVNGGQLQLEMSRKIMDLVQHGKDTRFMVNITSIDNVNKKLDYVETQTDLEARTLEIGFPLDKSTIEITSTTIMPDVLLPIIILIVISFSALLVFYRYKRKNPNHSGSG